MKPRLKPAKLVRCEQIEFDGKPMWIALDSAGRRFIAPTQAEAMKMLDDYNNPRKEKDRG